MSGAWDFWKTLGVEICLFYFTSLSHRLLQSVKVLGDMAVILFFTTVQTAFERWRKHPYILYALRPITILVSRGKPYQCLLYHISVGETSNWIPANLSILQWTSSWLDHPQSRQWIDYLLLRWMAAGEVWSAILSFWDLSEFYTNMEYFCEPRFLPLVLDRHDSCGGLILVTVCGLCGRSIIIGFPVARWDEWTVLLLWALKSKVASGISLREFSSITVAVVLSVGL